MCSCTFSVLSSNIPILSEGILVGPHNLIICGLRLGVRTGFRLGLVRSVGLVKVTERSTCVGTRFYTLGLPC